MSRSRLTQAALSASIAAVAALAVAQGAAIALFDLDVRRVEIAAAPPVPAERTQWVAVPETTHAGPGVNETLVGWRAVPGVATAARTIVAARTGASASLPQRLLEISGALSLAPTDGALWLAFADATLRLDYGADHAAAALDMATLTARREGDQMFARALLVLRAWEQMPEDRRQAAMAQLGELRWRFKNLEFKTIAALIAAKAPEVRFEISEALPVKLRNDKQFHKAVGL